MQPELSTVLWILVVLFSSYLFLKWFNAPTHRLKHIPTVGRHSGVLTSYFDAFRLRAHGGLKELIQEGYDRYYGSAFKVSTLFEWVVVVSGPQLTEDFRRAGEDHLLFEEFVAQALELDRTSVPAFGQNKPHIEVIRTSLTKNISNLFRDLADEVAVVFDDLVPQNKGGGWTTIPVMPSTRKIICRVVNRVLLGLSFCRDPEYISLTDKSSLDILYTLTIRPYFPERLTGLATRFLTNVPADVERFAARLRPVIEAESQGEKGQGGSDIGNAISWLLNEAGGRRPSIVDVALRVLAINFVAMETSAPALSSILYYLATYPEYVPPMRQEVEAIVAAEGWTRESMAKMHKVDSFIKETQRLTITSMAVHRKVVKDVTFSNGLFLPKGVKVAIATHATQTDERNYEDPLSFKPFRFARNLDSEDEVGGQGEDEVESDTSKRGDLISLSPTFLNFGIGRHACPGRFFAANELKAILVHVLLTYDVALPDLEDDVPPSPENFSEVVFRKRM